MPKWAFADLWATIQAGHPWRGIVKNRAKNGDHYWVRATVSPIIVDHKVVGYMSLRRKPTRQEVTHAEKLYRLAQAPKQSRSLMAWFSGLSLKVKLHLSVHLVVFGILAVSSTLIAHEFKAVSDESTYHSVLRNLGLGVGIIQVILFFVIGWIVHRFVAKPVEEITTSLNHLVNGDVRGQVDISGRDEMGKVLCAVQTSKIYLGSSFERVATVSNKLN